MVRRLPNDEPCRLARIHDAKYLHMGVDLKAFQQQLHAQQDARAVEAEEKRKAAMIEAAQAAVSQACHTKQLISEREALIKLQNFRLQSQGMQKARDWDLNRPDSLRIDLPARFGDDDPRCGPASIQKFSGEDLQAPVRQKEHREQDRQCWRAQVELKAKEAVMQAAAERAEQAKVRELDALQTSFQLLEKKQVKDTNMAFANLNKKAQERRKELEAQAAADEAWSNRKEIESMLSSEFLCELVQDCKPPLPSRIAVSKFKGMSKEAIEAIKAEQRQQSEQQKLAKAQGIQEEAANSQSQSDAAEKLRKDLLQVKIAKRVQDNTAASFIAKQIQEKVLRDETLDELYKNAVKAEYFEQFETSHR